MDLDQVVDELYALAPAEFTARRDALAAQAKREGDGDLAKRTRALRRPTAGAFAVNRLARAASDQLADYLAVGERLRAAQAGLDGALLRSLGRERQEASAALVDTAASLVDGGLSATARQEVEETLRAAVADPAASAAVASGRLTTALSYAGFGEVDVTAATATPLRPALRAVPDGSAAATPETSQPEGQEPGTPKPASAKPATAKPATPTSATADHVLAERRELADRQLAVARDDAQHAREAAERAASAEQEAAAAQQRADADVDDLRDRLARARIEARRAQQHLVTAQSERAAADRAARAAERELEKAERRRGALDDRDDEPGRRRHRG